MNEIMYISVISIYLIASFLLMIYGLHCYIMIILFMRRQKQVRAAADLRVEDYNQSRSSAEYPFVTIQLPVYNEPMVVERLLRSAAAVDYPADRFEIQVVDDSTDTTVGVVDAVAADLKKNGVDITIVRRSDRKGYKAGALANALKSAKGEFAAMFDADFLVPENFLKRSMALITDDENIACLQGRWGHLNRSENFLTRAQSVGIDGHFAAEQGARSYNRLCMNFNGTAGVWRISSIAAAGGWSGDTLTEDLDLSYRVQLAGFRIVYDFDLVCLAEIPNNAAALKTQQQRWAMGSIQTAVKLLPTIFRSKVLSFKQKIEAFLHMTHYFVSVLMVILCVITLPVLLGVPHLKDGTLLAVIWSLIVFSALAPGIMYWGSGMVQGRGGFAIGHFPLLLAIGSGLCLNNALAVVAGLCGRKKGFVRTPKTGSIEEHSRKLEQVIDSSLIQSLIEVGLGLYCLYTFIVYLQQQKFFFGFFIGAYAVGFLYIGCATLKQIFARVKLDDGETEANTNECPQLEL
jgi:cellulose synthase/poly-beta-1,6-N-acetylglucosamine synthase-like glycosyltransferase